MALWNLGRRPTRPVTGRSRCGTIRARRGSRSSPARSPSSWVAALWRRPIAGGGCWRPAIRRPTICPARPSPTGFCDEPTGNSWCEWKGQATYYDLVTETRVAPQAAWTYRQPSPDFRTHRGGDCRDGCGGGPLHGEWRTGDPAAGRFLRRLGHQLDCRAFQGNSGIHGLGRDDRRTLSALGAEIRFTDDLQEGRHRDARVWPDGDHLFVWTPADSWKAKRAKNNPRVALVPCSRGGKVRDGAEPVDGTAEVITEPATVQRLAGVIRRKYGLEFIVVTFIERVRRSLNIASDSVDRAYRLTRPVGVDSRMSSPSSESAVRQVSRMSAYSVGLPKKKLSWFSRASVRPSRL